jgi:diguanylate cyclase (GGDEF)-like protein
MIPNHKNTEFIAEDAAAPDKAPKDHVHEIYETIVTDSERFTSIQIWKSRIGWRITMAVFFAITLMYTIVMGLTVYDHHLERLKNLKAIGKATVFDLFEDYRKIPTAGEDGEFKPSILKNDVLSAFSVSSVSGMTLYDTKMEYVSNYGQPVSIVPLDDNRLPDSGWTEDRRSYEFFLKPDDIIAPYYVAVRISTGFLYDTIKQNIMQHMFLALILSALVTNILMITLGRWLVSPLLILRQNLLSAKQNPEYPVIQESDVDPNSEIGGTLKAAKALILQNAKNIKEIKNKAENEIHKLAFYDSLTGLPNRELFLKLLREKAVADSKRKKRDRYGVIAMDLDHFKDINDSMGHHIGDVILTDVGKRLQKALPKDSIVSRYGEDEFAILVPLRRQTDDAINIAKSLAQVIRAEPFKAFEENFQVRSSIGVAVYPDDSDDPYHVMKGADIALNRAKEDGRDTLRAYSKDFDIAVKERFQMLRDLRLAMDENQLRLFYQPQLDLKTGQVVGVEALIRWWKPDPENENEGRFVSPLEFISIAENSGLIIPMGTWVINHACERLAAWSKLGHKDLRMAVNVSGAQFVDGALPDILQKVLKKTKIKPHRLEVEVTESLFMEDVDQTIETLHQINDLGVEVAIDDFGTGYSSLSYLRQFPIDRLKVDRSFIDNASDDSDDGVITKTIIALGHSLGLQVVAEGVEDVDQEKFLINQGCDIVQGFRYSRPLPEDEFLDFLKSYNGKLSSFK